MNFPSFTSNDFVDCTYIAPFMGHCYLRISNKYGSLTRNHRISIPAYAIEQQEWQSGVPKNEMSLMSLIFNNDASSIAKRDTMWHYFNNCWHATKWSSISFSHWQCPSDGDFSFLRFVGLLILSLCSEPISYEKYHFFEIT
jgi:hypothetical protein